MPLVGCTMTPLVDATAMISSTPADTPVAPDKTTLPPDQAARACLATAEQLAAHEHEAEAILEYEQARRYVPNLPNVARKLAVLYDRQGDVAHAQAEYTIALAAAPRDADLLNDLGYFYYQNGNWSEAERTLSRALQLNPKHNRAWINLGLVLGEAERYQESYDAFAKAVSPAEAHSNLGVLLARQGKTVQAREELTKALALEPALRPAQLVLARLD